MKPALTPELAWPLPRWLMDGMFVLHRLALAASCFAAFCAGAHASSSDPFRTEGASLRLITTGLPDEEGRLLGALEIALDPGWKTYWKEPGASGVPPQINVDRSLNVTAARLGFPPPAWHEDDYGAWAGYGEPVLLPIVFSVGDPERFSVVEADLFLGVCETICVPVQASLTVEPGSAPDDPADRALVSAAFQRLPLPADAGFGVTDVALSIDVLTVSAAVPGTEEAALFLAPSAGFSFGMPRLVARNGTTAAFSVPVLSRPAAARPVEIGYTLVSGTAAVDGSFTLP